MTSKLTFKKYHNFLGQAKEFLNLKDEKYLKKVKIKKKGGYPRGLKKGDGQVVKPESFTEQDVRSETEDRLNFDVDQNGPEETIENREDGEKINQDKMGLIRKIDNAHLVYKRQVEDGTFTELWLYYNDILKAKDIRKHILAGTDIDPATGFSEDGSQTYEIWSPGNCEMLKITGLPS